MVVAHGMTVIFTAISADVARTSMGGGIIFSYTHVTPSESAIIKKMAACRSEKSYFPNLVGCKNIKNIFNEPYKFNQICLLSHENFC